MFAGFNNLGNRATGSNPLEPAWAELRSRSAMLDHWWWLNKDNQLGWRGGSRGAQPTCKCGGEPFNSRERAASKAVVVFLVDRLHLHLNWIPINLQFFNQSVLLFNFIHFKICNVGLIPDSPGYGLNLTKGTSFWLKHLEKKTFDLIDFWEERTLFSAITLFAFNFSFSNTFIQVCWFAYTHALSGVLKIHFYFSFTLSSVRYFYASICSYL